MDINNSFFTIDEQINHLKKVGINFGSEIKVRKVLEKNSYYNIINGYNEPFLFMKSPKKYLRNLDFFEIHSLYLFDNKIRNIIFPYLLEIENILKSEIVYAFSNSRDIKNNLLRKNDDYLKIENYDQKSLCYAVEVIAEFQKIISKYFNRSDAITHYITKYSFVPLWVLSVFMTFGDISKFYNVLKINDRQCVSKKYSLSEDELRTILRVLTLTRNSCAHRNRLYCLTHKYTLPTFDLKKHPKAHMFVSRGNGNKNLFCVLICLSVLLDNKQMKSMINAIDNEINILSKKLKVIPITKILDNLGFPTDWKNII